MPPAMRHSTDFTNAIIAVRKRPKHDASARALPALIAIVGLVALMAILFARSAHRKGNAGGESYEERDMDRFICIVYNQLKSYGLSQTNYPALTAEELHQRGVFDDQTMAFLKLRNVHFYPFSSTDPDTNPVLSVLVSPGHKMSIPFKNTVIEFPPVKVDLTKAEILNTNLDYAGLLDLNMYR
jgi:hypothetical protein